MVKTGDNLFSSLLRRAYGQGENFTTEAFVWLLKLLLDRERSVGQRLIGRLCFGKEACPEVNDSRLLISTQELTEEGKPDICVSSTVLLAFVEVKTGSGLGKDQIGRYLRALEQRANGRTTRLTLLTRGSVEFAEAEAKPHLSVRWHAVADWLCQETERIESESVRFAVEQFVGFLEEQIMSIEHVGWEYTNGIIAMRRLVEMLEEALHRAEIEIYKKTPSWTWMGYYLKNKEFWVGIRYAEPNRLLLGYEDATADSEKLSSLEDLEASGLPIEQMYCNGKAEFVLRLDDERVHFFAMSKENQLIKLIDFLKKAYSQALACKEE